jgi:uncharacterized membrane protein
VEEEKKPLRVGSFAAHSARGVVRDQSGRRKAMMVTLVVAVAMALLGSTLLAELLDYHQRPVWFVLFWGACAWITVTAMLLAVFDLLMVRAQARMAGRTLRERMGASPDSPSAPPSE